MQTRWLVVALGWLSLAGGTARAEEWGPWPYVVFTTGKQWNPAGDLIEDKMTSISDMLRDDFDAEVRSNSWNCYGDGKHEFDSGCPTNDATFLADLGAHLNSLPYGRPVIVLGHSYGGDSLLKAVNGANGISRKVDHPIMAMVVLDPTSTAGERKTRHAFYGAVPSTVSWFFNRWQQNSPVPFNFADSGQLDRGCAAGTCAENEHRYERNADGSTVNDCGWVWTWDPPARFVWRCDPRKSNHGSLVGDAEIQRIVRDELRRRLASRRIVTLLNQASNRFLVTEGGGGSGQVVNANRATALQWEHLEIGDVNGGALSSGDEITLASYNGFYVSAEPDGRVLAERSRAFGWETFRIYKWPYTSSAGTTIVSGDSIYLISFHDSKAVTLNPDGVSVGLTGGCNPTARCLFRLSGRTQ